MMTVASMWMTSISATTTLTSMVKRCAVSRFKEITMDYRNFKLPQTKKNGHSTLKVSRKVNEGSNPNGERLFILIPGTNEYVVVDVRAVGRYHADIAVTAPKTFTIIRSELAGSPNEKDGWSDPDRELDFIDDRHA